MIQINRYMLQALVFLLLFNSSGTTNHPFFVSVIEAEYFKKEKLVGISCKIFTDDLENALKKFSAEPVDIVQGNKNENREKLSRFFPKHLKVKLNGQKFPYEVLGYENDHEAVFVFLEIKDCAEPGKFEVETDLLYELDKSQVNLVHYIHNGVRQTKRLTFPSTAAVFE